MNNLEGKILKSLKEGLVYEFVRYQNSNELNRNNKRNESQRTEMNGKFQKQRGRRILWIRM